MTEHESPFESVEAWRGWLDEHHTDTAGIWLRLAKVSSGVPSVTYRQALEVALCYGWIDGQKKPVDDDLVAAAVHAAAQGQQVVEDQPRQGDRADRGRADAARRAARGGPAKADGRWDAAYAGQRTATVPDDLAAALAAKPRAGAAFAAADSRNRYAILYRVEEAKKPETRARRIEKFVAMLDEGKLLYP